MSQAPALSIHHDPEAQCFWAEPEPGLRCELDYRRHGDAVVFIHTGVPPALQGRGLAARLVDAGLAWAQTQGLVVQSQCSYVTAHLARRARTR